MPSPTHERVTVSLGKEDDELIQSFRSTKYASTTNLLNIMFTISSLKLKPPENAVKQVGGTTTRYNTLRANLRPSALSCLRGNDWRAYVSVFLFILAGYVSAKRIVMALCQIEYDRHLHNLNPEVKDNATRTDKCALSEDIVIVKDKRDLYHYDKLMVAKDWLDIVGNQISALHGTGTLLHLSFSLVILTYLYYSVFFLGKNDIRVDYLNFIFDPIKERARIRAELRSIITVILCSFKNFTDNVHHLEKVRQSQPVTCLSPDYDQINRCEHNSACSSYLRRYRKEREGGTYLMKVLLDPRLVDLVQPAHLSSASYKSKLYVNSIYISSAIVANCITSLFFTCFTTYNEICTHTNQRLDLIECSKWNSAGKPIKQDLYLKPLESERDRFLYLSYDGTKLDYLYLAFFVELKYHTTLHDAISMLEAVGGCILIGLLVSFYLSLYINSYADQIVWLAQLERQLEQNASMMSENKFQANSTKLVRSTIMSYLNFELFRRQQSHYQLLANFLLSLPLFVTLITYIMVFLLSSVDRKLNLIMALALTGYQSVVINAFLFSTAHRTQRIEKLMKRIAQMLTKSTQLQLDIDLRINRDLWRRQLLTFEDTRRLLAPNILGMHISYEQVITFNAYFTAIWALVIRLSL